MSEQKLLQSSNPKPTDASDAFGAIRDQQRAIGWTGDPSHGTVAEETFTDLDNYLNNRPKNPSKVPADTNYEDSLAEQTSIEDVSMDDLVAKWAEADDSNDRTASLAVQDEIERRLVADDKMSDELRLKFIDRLVARKEALQNGTNVQAQESEVAHDAGTPPPFNQEEYNQQNGSTESSETGSDIGDKAFGDKSFKELVDDNPGIARDLLGLPNDSEQTTGAGTPPPFNQEEFDRRHGNNGSETTDSQEVVDDGRFDFRDNDHEVVDAELVDDLEVNNPDQHQQDDEEFDFSRGGGEQQGGSHFELDPELAQELADARSAYARLDAKRSGLVIGRKNRKALEIARKRYQDALDTAGQWVAGRLRDGGESESSIRTLATEGVIAELHATAEQAYELQVRGADSKRLKGFYEKWASWGGKFFSKEGLKGNAKKMATMFAVTAVPAAAVGIFGAAFLGAGTVAALAGVGAVRGLNRNLLGAKIDRNAEASTNIARIQLDEQLARDEARIRSDASVLAEQQGEEPEFLNASDVTRGIDASTARDISRNRKRTAKAGALGATLGAVGGLAVANLLGFGGTGSGRPSTGGNTTGGGSGADVASGPKGGLPNEPEAPTEVIPNPNAPGATVPEVATPEVVATPSVGAGGGLPELVVNDSRLPWTHVTDVLNNGNGTPDIFAAVEKGRQMGINIVGRGRGLESVTWNGITYTDNGHINAALDYIMTHEA